MSETISGTVKQVREYVASKGLSAKITDPLAELEDDRHVMLEVGNNGDLECLHEAETQAECSEKHAVHRREKYGR